MSLMLKLLTITILVGSSLFANVDSDVIDFEKSRIAGNPMLQLEEINIAFHKKLRDNWSGYVLDIKLNIPRQHNKKVNIKDTLFTNGKVITPALMDLRTHKDFKNEMVPLLSKKYFTKEHFIAGKFGAKHTLVVFSDPLCPFCIRNLPKVYKAIKNSKNIAMFYYDFPLVRLHPASNIITRYLILAKKKGVKDLIYKLYTANLEKHFSIKETNPKVIVPVLNKIFGLKIAIKDIMSKGVAEALKQEIKMGEDAMVRGTPTIFFDGKQDPSRSKFKKYLK